MRNNIIHNNDPALNGFFGWVGRALKNTARFLETNLPSIGIIGDAISLLSAAGDFLGTDCKVATITDGYYTCRPLTVDENPVVILSFPEEVKLNAFLDNQFNPYYRKLMLKANSVVSDNKTPQDRLAVINEIYKEMALVRAIAKINDGSLSQEAINQKFDFVDQSLTTVEDLLAQTQSDLLTNEGSVVVSTDTVDVSPIQFNSKISANATVFGNGATASTVVTNDNQAVTTEITTVSSTGVVTTIPITQNPNQPNTNSNKGIIVVAVGALLIYGLHEAFGKKKQNKKSK